MIALADFIASIPAQTIYTMLVLIMLPNMLMYVLRAIDWLFNR